MLCPPDWDWEQKCVEIFLFRFIYNNNSSSVVGQ